MNGLSNHDGENNAYAAITENGKVSMGSVFLNSVETWKKEQAAKARKEAASERNRKVVTLANKLSAGGNDKSIAFKKAWQIVKAGAVTFPVKGVTFGNRQAVLKRLAEYSPESIRAWVEPEPDNPADKNALAVMVSVQGGRGACRIGYIPANEVRLVKNLTGLAAIRIVGGDYFWHGSAYVNYGARITLSA